MLDWGGDLMATTTHGAGGRAARSSSAGGRTQAVKAHAHVASHTPGRVRVRVHHPHRHPELLNRVREQLRQTPGVDQVEVNPHSGSVLVHYDHHASSMDDILGALRDVGMIVGTVAGADELPGDDGSDEAGTHSSTATGFVGTINDLDQRLSRVTGRKVDLKLLFPVVLGALGVQSAVRNGIGLSEVPAYILIWYAFDSFWKFHSAPAARTSTNGNGVASQSADTPADEPGE
jgi:copper chaperone CopZ